MHAITNYAQCFRGFFEQTPCSVKTVCSCIVSSAVINDFIRDFLQISVEEGSSTQLNLNSSKSSQRLHLRFCSFQRVINIHCVIFSVSALHPFVCLHSLQSVLGCLEERQIVSWVEGCQRGLAAGLDVVHIFAFTCLSGYSLLCILKKKKEKKKRKKRKIQFQKQGEYVI